MPSPFPGMNPDFERAAHWQDFHSEILSTLRRRLAPQIAPDSIIQPEEHVYIHDLPPEPRRLPGRPDLSVAHAGGAQGRPVVAVLEAPAEVRLPAQDVERVPYLEVRDRRGRELVTVTELLSPSDKRSGDDRQQYLGKRREPLRGLAHLVEVDLLRGGAPMPADDRPQGDYSVLVSRVERRPAAESWPIRLRDRLPMIPIPLRPADPDAQVDLQDVLHQAHDGPGHEHFIYEGSPEPSPSDEDARWAGQFLPKPA